MMGQAIVLDRWTVLLLTVVFLHIEVAPFTKVEESFNLQAVHDLLYHRADLAAYDHHQFPGVVPRTFLGAMVVATASAPWVAMMSALGAAKLYSQYIARAALGTLWVLSLSRLRGAVQRVVGKPAGVALMLLTAAQFHLPFYCSRPLPNTLAGVAANLGLADWFDGTRPRRAVAALVFATVVLRCDLLLLLGPVGICMLLTRQLSFLDAVATGVLSVAASLAASVAVDSVFWGRWLWPEGEVLWFNTAENRSHEWGTQPVHWYWTSALPRALVVALPLALWAPVAERRVRLLLAVAVAFVALYSNLPHKELRFLLPVLPLFNVAAAAAAARLWANRHKSAWRMAQLLMLAGGLLLTCAFTALSLTASHYNYPGGHAMLRMHQLPSSLSEPPLCGDVAAISGGAAAAAAAVVRQGAGGASSQGITWVHVGVLPAMTGVSRFGELPPPWHYSKEEGIPVGNMQQRNFTYLLSGEPAVEGFNALETVTAYAGLQMPRSPGQLLEALREGRSMLQVLLQPSVYVHQRCKSDPHEQA